MANTLQLIVAISKVIETSAVHSDHLDKSRSG